MLSLFKKLLTSNDFFQYLKGFVFQGNRLALLKSFYVSYFSLFKIFFVIKYDSVKIKSNDHNSPVYYFRPFFKY